MDKPYTLLVTYSDEPARYYADSMSPVCQVDKKNLYEDNNEIIKKVRPHRSLRGVAIKGRRPDRAMIDIELHMNSNGVKEFAEWLLTELLPTLRPDGCAMNHISPNATNPNGVTK